jgi:hypothetical protein
MNRRPIIFFILILVLASLSCQVLGNSEEPTPTATVQPTPTLAPTATPDPDSTPLGALITETTESADGSGENTLGGDQGTNGASTPEPEPSSDGSASAGNPDPTAISQNGSDGGGNGSGEPIAVACPVGGQNLLLNPSFEGEYKPFGAIRELNHAPNWFPWWKDSDGNFRPEYKPAEISTAPNRIHSGDRAQQYFKSFGQFKAGLFQSALNILPGSRLQFSAFGQAWSCQDFSTCSDGSSVNPANMLMRVGIDPTGDTNSTANTIIWSPYFNPLDSWQIACIEAIAERDIVTVYLWASPDGPRQNQDVYWDDASLVVLP